MPETDETLDKESISSTDASGSPVVDPNVVDEIPVAVQVHIGSVTLPLAELQQIEPGAILTLEEATASQVEILAGEKTIARGEIVTVDDQLAVRILQILGSEPTGEE